MMLRFGKMLSQYRAATEIAKRMDRDTCKATAQTVDTMPMRAMATKGEMYQEGSHVVGHIGSWNGTVPVSYYSGEFWSEEVFSTLN